MSKVSGLTTIALLKANYDEGMDYLEMFMPFVLHVVSENDSEIIEVESVQKYVKEVFEINIPQEVVKKLLNKGKRKGALIREGGKFFKNKDYKFNTDLNKKRKNIDRQLNTIGERLLDFLQEEGLEINDRDDALAILFKFLSNQELELLLDIEYENKPIDSDALKSRKMRSVAKFVKEICLKDPILAIYLDNILTGFILQNALLLKNVATPSKVFDNLQIFLDSGFLLGLLGWKGAARELANKDTLDLLKATNAHLAVFEPTIEELKRILYTYQRHLGTQKGRETLWQSAITRHVLSEQLTPSDIKQAISLIENTLEFKYGITIHETPERKPEYTHDEEKLARKLGVKNEENPSKRIIHDIDCVAAVLTLRRGDIPRTLDSTNAIFMSGSSSVVNDVNEWYKKEGGKHVPPIIHHLTISNIAWLKRPDVGSKMKINELVALCTAALRPKQETWTKFLTHLKKLEDSGELTSDESVAIVASNLIETELIELEDHNDDDIDSSSVSEIVERVKNGLIVESKEKEKELLSSIEKKDKELGVIDSNISKYSENITNIIFAVAALLIIAGSFLFLPGVSETFNLGLTGYILAAIITLLTAFALITGFKLTDYKKSVNNNVKSKLRSLIRNKE
jgi:hypothetical protein